MKYLDSAAALLVSAALGCGLGTETGGADEGTGGVGGGTETRSTTAPEEQDAGAAGAGSVGGGATVGPICDELGSCGDFGNGCVGCAIGASCSAEYDACASSDECRAYNLCMGECPVEPSECLTTCSEAFPVGAIQFEALLTCVVCGECATACANFAESCS